MVVSLVEDVVLPELDGSGPSVHLQSRVRFRRPATGVSGHESLSESEESRLSPARGAFGRGEFSKEANADEEVCSEGESRAGDDDASDEEDD